MEYSLVFDNQKMYRATLDTMSRPGTIKNVSEISNKLSIDLNCFKTTGCLMLMLLDADTSFHLVTKDDNLVKRFKQISYSPYASIEEASFIFVTRDSLSEIKEVITKSNIGDLYNPHASATIIVECDELANDMEYVLKGCGIKEEQILSVKPDFGWCEARNSKNSEFPLGVDMIFVGCLGNIVSLPRTTQIVKGV